MTFSIDQFINKLITIDKMQNVINPYSLECEHHEIARNNLKIYMERMIQYCPKFLFVGEAPGYKGCKLTGVPFTSEKLLLSPKGKNQIIGIEYGYQARGNCKLASESSATIMWKAFEDYNIYPLLWNAFPFHPHKLGNEFSNRAPNRSEVELGRVFLKELIEIYNIEKVYAVGNIAHETLSSIGIENEKLRHPSMGGKPEFINGIERIVGTNR